MISVTLLDSLLAIEIADERSQFFRLDSVVRAM
jgi:hypothetical protein